MINKTDLETNKFNINEYIAYDYESIDSTNEQLKRLLEQVGERKLIVVSNEQVKGKGRMKHNWLSPYKSGLYASWSFLDREINNGILSVLIGFNCLVFLRTFVRDKIFLKWPNDLIAREKKLGGILIEKINNFTIVGIGINLIKDDKLLPTAISMDMLDVNYNLNFKELRDNLLTNLTTCLENTFNLSLIHI